MNTEPIYTFYQINFNNFTYNEGDYVIVKTLNDLIKILDNCEHELDDSEEKSITIKGVPMTNSEYQKHIETYFED